jgi:phosphoribosylglycinamide formyltransferase-1
MAEAAAKLAILASGKGSNAERLMRLVANRDDVEVALVATNHASSGVLDCARILGVPTWVFDKTTLAAGGVTEKFVQAGIRFVALAGFLLKVPEDLVAAYPNRMMNLHPALLPAFGGKGMYGRHVHKAVHAAMQRGEVTETGMTLHWVNAEYDEGPAFFQARVPLDGTADTPESIEHKVKALEEAHYAPQVLRAVSESLSLSGIATR